MKEVSVGTIRVKVKNLKSYKKTATGWKLYKKEFPELLNVVKLFKAHRKLNHLIDTKNSQFLKGQLSSQGLAQGARINILPNGKKLEKAFSLFSPHLKIHDQFSHDHWDVLYQNKGGTWSYVYTLEKRKNHQNKKYKKVEEFEKKYSLLESNVAKALLDKKDLMAVPIHTLLKTYMRVGNEIYFKSHKHKGLTTLTKNDVKVQGNLVTFNYVGKDGVPIKILQKFSTNYIRRLNQLLKSKNQFIFSKSGKTLNEHDFSTAFKKYCGSEFYPHIVRSHYATMMVKRFLAKKQKITKENVEKLLKKIAHNLGHKKFNKKTQEWQEHYTVTVNNYIQPELLKKIKV